MTPTEPGISKSPHRRYSHSELHRLLINQALSGAYRAGLEIGAPALDCPYFVPLSGRLGADWGVIVNPASSRFAQLTFEHDDCGCPATATEDAQGLGRHSNSPSQDGDTWDINWAHVCGDLCPNPCPRD